MNPAAICERLTRAAWSVAAEQVAPLMLLLDPATHGGKPTGYAETAISHTVLVPERRFILRRPQRLGGERLLTPQDRWTWCEAQAERIREAQGLQSARVLPIVRRGEASCLGGPGDVLAWVLECALASALRKLGPAPGSDVGKAREHRLRRNSHGAAPANAEPA